MAYPEKVPITWEQKRIAQEQLPKALMFGSGLINKFWNDISKSDMRTVCIKYSLTGAGGDHSDDASMSPIVFIYKTKLNLVKQI